MKTLAERTIQLKDRLAELDKRVHQIEDELESHNNPDWEELAVERETDEVLESMGLSAQGEMSAIRAALVRIQEGTYGDCLKCGNPISEKRLDLVPFTGVCVGCVSVR